ncbi:MAG: 16S rRNA (cytosine(1402)-N(4))-methyltransferase RsmH [Rhodospirillaceae bacterium]|jgi:16S rRNA (cytosine1402-N4)-methyltransferase|nr:16S rRNA (cytosine(1402)-N(4))-methyltransferase RsmH [Rhodospirillaceae bacterium]MBT4589501.1 16S rRNA (cytosine(1402)-N(4))-methyltransferase RsmH [Rhodospirillaceae bacterium]MBT7268229.1 16S rRNA (cytosine(1402)-N(4))-methyltransferase RsmH [Rhodospirillaceae bacterium]
MTNDHIPVMANEVLTGLNLRDGGIYVDGTFGRGGYSQAILEAAATRVFGIDRDPAAITFGAELSDKYDGRLTVLEGCFGDMAELMAKAGIESVDGVTLDLGVSSPQIDDPVRGFSFRFDGPLDMRMSGDGPTAADFVNEAGEEEIADVIYHYGEERYSRRIARGIVEARAIDPILSTAQLVGIIHKNVRRSKDGIDPATRTFMALRIQVNDELGELERGLIGAEKILAPGGRLVVVSFHSLEDRRVKSFLHERSGATGRGSRHMPELPADAPIPSFKLIKRGAIKPSETEASENPRARSARLRVAERSDAPAWSNRQ